MEKRYVELLQPKFMPLTRAADGKYILLNTISLFYCESCNNGINIKIYHSASEDDYTIVKESAETILNKMVRWANGRPQENSLDWDLLWSADDDI